MARGFRLTEQASGSPADISLWTHETFGARQADRYIGQLIGRVAAVAGGRVPSRACRDAFGVASGPDIRFILAGRHIVLFRDNPDEILILDFLHQSADLTRRLETPQ